MTSWQQTPVARLGDAALSMGDLMRQLHRHGALKPLLREAAIARFLQQEARAAALSVPAAELQQAANRWRRAHGLGSAVATQQWLEQEQMSVEELESRLEGEILIEKLKDHLTQGAIAAHFSSARARFDRIALSVIEVAREDEARELVSQLRDEGGEFAELARAHSRHASRAQGGALGLVRRGQMTPEAAAAAFAAAPGAVVGPMATPRGFQIFLVGDQRPAELDAEVTASIRQELFGAWLRAQLTERKLDLSLLSAL